MSRAIAAQKRQRERSNRRERAVASFRHSAKRASTVLPAGFARLAHVAAIIVPAASAAARTATISLRPRFVHGQLASAGVLAIQGGNGLFRFFIIRHFDKPKAA